MTLAGARDLVEAGLGIAGLQFRHGLRDTPEEQEKRT